MDNLLKKFIGKMQGKKKTKQYEDSFSQNERRYAYDVILTAMQEEATNEGSDLFSHLSQLHKELVSTDEGKKSIAGVDTFGLINEALDSVKKINYREKIIHHGRSYIFGRMAHNRKVGKLDRRLADLEK